MSDELTRSAFHSRRPTPAVWIGISLFISAIFPVSAVMLSRALSASVTHEACALRACPEPAPCQRMCPPLDVPAVEAVVPAPAQDDAAEPPSPPSPPSPPEIKERPARPSIVRDCDSCDDGFPAISEDGRLIAIKAWEREYGGGLYIRLVRASDLRPIREVLIRRIDDPDDNADWRVDWQGEPLSPAIVAEMEQRAASMQAFLHRRGFRPLLWMPTPEIAGEPEAGYGSSIAHGLELRLIAHADELDGVGIQLMDADSGWMLHQEYFDPVEEFGPAPDDGADMCHPTKIYASSVWVDRQTRTVLFEISYGASSCMCGASEPRRTVRKLPEVPEALQVPGPQTR